MRNQFKGYYRPTEEEFSQLWENCIFVFDTNTLLNVYRYSEKTRESFLNILERIKDRIWIPYQVGYEYQENRLEVISQQLEFYDSIKKEMNESIQKLRSLLEGRKKHPLIDIDQLMETIQVSFQTVESYLEEIRAKHPDFITSDDLRERITQLFDSKVGKPYSEDDLGKLFKEAEERYKQQIPPGYKDSSAKADNRKFGDYIIWSELLDFAKSERKPLVFITGDVKEDWWLIYKNKIIGPRPQLIQEMIAKGGVSFYMYQL
jgi:hypothetical protein